MEPFMLRALAAALALAVIAAPLGCVVVWNRMAYFGETLAQASLLGVALGLFLKLDLTLAVLVVAALVAVVLLALGRRRDLPLDAVLGLLHHAALAAGIIATALLQGPAVDLMGYLFGDVYAVTTGDLYWVAGGGLAVLAALAWLWPDLLRLAVHRELAEAEGVEAARVRFAFTLLLAFTVAIAMKIVGALLIIAFLIVPVVAARPFAATPERMAVLAAAFAAAGVGAGLWLSSSYDAPGGPSIVLSMAAMAALALAVAPRRRTQ